MIFYTTAADRTNCFRYAGKCPADCQFIWTWGITSIYILR